MSAPEPPQPHTWSVRLIVVPIGTRFGAGVRRYLPWCLCGWIGDYQAKEVDATRQAYQHATGARTAPRNPPRRRHRPEQERTGRLFDPDAYTQNGENL